MTLELRKFLFDNVYHHPDVATANNNAVEKIRELFLLYLKKPELMTKTTQCRIKQIGLHRATADYIAGMTDRFALIEWEKHCSLKNTTDIPVCD